MHVTLSSDDDSDPEDTGVEVLLSQFSDLEDTGVEAVHTHLSSEEDDEDL